MNLTRWIAAALVVLEHVRSLLFEDFGLIESPDVTEKGFYFATGFGHEAVVIFFVTSGFLVGGKAWDLMRQGRFEWRRYFADRVSRLYSVLVAALLIGGLLDWTGSHFDSFGFYTNQTPEPVAVIGGSFVERLTFNHFAVSLLMFQEVWLPSFGSNGPLWSLAHEWWYYLLFPLILGCLQGRILSQVFQVALVAVLCWLLTPYILILFGVWLLGAVGWRLNHRRWVSPLVALPIFLAGLILMRLEIDLFPFAHQYVLGFSFALLLNSFAQSQNQWPLGITSKWLADFSYSLYLIHFPVVLLVISALFTATERVTRFELTFATACLYVGVVLTAYLASFCVSLFTEAKTRPIRNGLYRVLLVPSTRPQ